ncbi:MAG: YggT family protein [Chloroflexota bacterium]
MIFLRGLILLLSGLLELLVIAYVILSYVMDRYHPVRLWVNSIVEPMLMPIRQVIPPVGMLDLSPMVLLILIQIISNLIIKIL